MTIMKNIDFTQRLSLEHFTYMNIYIYAYFLLIVNRALLTGGILPTGFPNWGALSSPENCPKFFAPLIKK